MEISAHNILRIKEWIQAEMDYNFLYPRYSNVFTTIKFYLTTMNLNKFALIAS